MSTNTVKGLRTGTRFPLEGNCPCLGKRIRLSREENRTTGSGLCYFNNRWDLRGGRMKEMPDRDSRETDSTGEGF